jgi:hypothetical protein
MTTTPSVRSCLKPGLPRRHVLRGAGAFLSLPWLESMLPSLARPLPAAASPPSSPRRLVAIHVPLGMMPQFFFPPRDRPVPAGEAGGGKAVGVSSPYLDLLSQHRDRWTVFAGLSHPEVDGNHHAGQCFLTGAAHPGQPNFRNSMSLDQLAAESLGLETRFPFLAMSVRNGEHYADSISVSRSGVAIPAETSPRKLYRQLFVAGTPEEKRDAMRRIAAGESVLDLILDKALVLERSVAAADRPRLEQYFQSVRELELRLQRAAAWESIPKPTVDYPEPEDIADANRILEKSRLMFDLIRLALESDSTRFVTLSLSTFSVVPHVPGVKNETHGLTHHGNEPEKIEELRKIEEAQLRVFSGFLQGLGDVQEHGQSLLDQTQVLYGSCLGNANSHSTQNLPLLLAGGGFRHPGYLAFDEQRNEPLANLFVTMLQRLGLELDTFASSTGSLRGLTA